MKESKRAGFINSLLVTLLLVCVIFLFVAWQHGKQLSEKMDLQRLKYEALLSEKLLLEKSHLKDSTAIQKIGISVSSLTRQLVASKEAMTGMQRQYNTLRASHERLTDTLIQAKKNTASLKLLHASWKDSLSLSVVGNRVLRDSLQHLASIVEDYRRKLVKAMTESIDRTLISSFKRNNRLTIKASKTKRLLARVELPDHLTGLRFNIEGPDANSPGKAGRITSKVVDSHKQMTASIGSQIAGEAGYQTVEITYSPEERLTPGIYTIQIHNDEAYIGCFQTKLN